MSDKPREYMYAGRLDEATRLEAQARIVDQIIQRELEILDIKPKMRVLDAGCGTGAITRRIASKVFPAEVFGVDIGLIGHWFTKPNRMMEIGFNVVPNERGKGYGSEAVQLMVDYLFLSRYSKNSGNN